MIKIIESAKHKNRVIRMSEMKPLQVGQIISTGDYHGEYVLRTGFTDNGEIMSMSIPDHCWNTLSSLKVRLLGPGESITVELFNEE